MKAPNGDRTNRIGLVGILLGMLLGGLLGAVYGRQMWIAAGGPQAKIQRLERTVQQKEKFAAEAQRRAEQMAAEGKPDAARHLDAQAAHWRSQVGAVRQEIANVQAVARQAEQTDQRIPLAVWEIVRFSGDVFLRALKMMVIPLVLTSMICGITSLGDVRRLGKVGGWTILFYLATSAIAVLVGMLLVEMIQPGTRTNDTFAYVSENVLAKQDKTPLTTLLEVVRGSDNEPGSGMIPDNLFQAASQTNVLAMIIFALIFGAALSTLGEKGKPAVAFFHAANDAVMKIVHWIIFLAPIGIFGLVATRVAASGGGRAFQEELARLGWFVLTVMLGLAIQTAVLCAILALFARRNPARYVYEMARALLTALSTGSSSATLPVTIECVEASGVSERSAGFVLPLGATINMNGTALYEATAAVFIAQSLGIQLDGISLAIVFLTATLAAMGAPGIPEAGLVTMLVVLAAVGLPAAGIGTILAIDWFLDRQRTTVNVFGDMVGAAVVDRYLQPVPSAPSR